MRQFPASPITELIDGSPQYNLGESYAPHLSVADILDPAEVAGLSLGYGTSAGDQGLRALVAGVWLLWSEHRGAGRVVPVVRPAAGLRHRNATLRCPGQQRCHIAVRLRRGGAPGSRGVRGVRGGRFR